MKPELDSQKTISLLIKEVTEGLNGQEVEELNAWINASEANKGLYEKLYSAEYKKQRLEMKSQFDTETAWNDVLKEIEPVKKGNKYSVFWRYASVAASILLLVGSFYFRDFFMPKEDTSMTMAKFEPGTSVAILTLADGRQIELDNLDTTINVLDADIAISAKGISYTAKKHGPDKKAIAYHTLQTPRGGEYHLTLPDGSKVWLNAESKLIYPESFSGKNRMVSVEGEVYFDVVKNAQKPFIVNVGSSTINVLGTSFNVKSYSNDRFMETTLVEGSIKWVTPRGLERLLQPNEQLQLDSQSGKINVRKVSTENYTAWKDGRFIYDNQSLDDIMRSLCRWYDFEYQFDQEALKKIHFSVDVKRYENMNKILNMIEATKKVRIKQKENGIVIY